ncbi:hypothetical protein [Bradyrhizobium sp. CCGUVB23]|uniref:hypothetical protein n=1 Tax=Bradyrhizobium sp. CCGUVB23 TaxID=2949630 RepID=UPI0020B237CD|nr:hypothetical protein [Bradyrhizobium sp. CCGUVB23]MCP3462421.1 hypothetical protein [Bradyrhizobium sp. CCGUVB23]
MVGFPLLLIPLAVYNIIVFLMHDVSFTAVLFKVPMLEGQVWPVTLSDLLLALGVVLLLLEIVKGARPGAKFLMDHLLSLIVFGAAAAEFVMWPEKFGNSTFFLLVLLAMADFFGGVAQRTRRRAYVTEAAPAPRKARRQVEEEADEPVVEPRMAPAPQPAPVVPPAPAPSAQSVAESVLMDPPAPKAPQAAPSPEIPSPHLQPSNGTPTSPDTPQR